MLACVVALRMSSRILLHFLVTIVHSFLSRACFVICECPLLSTVCLPWNMIQVMDEMLPVLQSRVYDNPRVPKKLKGNFTDRYLMQEVVQIMQTAPEPSTRLTAFRFLTHVLCDPKCGVLYHIRWDLISLCSSTMYSLPCILPKGN
mgnify:CR=1 FL=1